MSSIEERRKYARKRKFEYPEERISQIDNNSPQYALPCEDTNEGIDRDADIYALAADQAIERGDLNEAMELLFKSVDKYHNVESIAQIADLMSIMFIKQYGNTGYNGNDESTNYLVASALGLYSAYGMLTNDNTRVSKVINAMGALFHNKGQFQGMLQRIREKCEKMSPEQIIEFIKH